MEEARLEQLESGLAPATPGWFVLNVRDAVWDTHDTLGAACHFEGEEVAFAELGVNVRVLSPGRTKWLYHAESGQEDFLVLAGECLLLVEGEERPLRAWDFVHCPPGTAHAFVATGAGPCVIVMVGARPPGWPGSGIVYPRSEVALRHGVGIENETSSPAEAWAALGLREWRPGRPADWDALPWARDRA
jgi:uncharacterized cupin superfamily protein